MTKEMKSILRKIFINRTNILIFLIFVLGVSSYLFRSNIGSLIWSIKYKSPIVWKDLKIVFPKEMRYKEYDKSIWFYYWENPKSFLSFKTLKPKNMQKNYLVQFFREKGFQLTEVKDIYLSGFPSFEIEYINESGSFNKNIYVIPKNLLIHYEGEKGDYKYFVGLIQSIKFL